MMPHSGFPSRPLGQESINAVSESRQLRVTPIPTNGGFWTRIFFMTVIDLALGVLGGSFLLVRSL